MPFLVSQVRKCSYFPSRAMALFHEYEIDGSDKAEEGCEVIPMQALSLEEDVGDDSEDDERYTFLYHLELNQVEGAAIVDKSYSVGRNLAAILKKCNRPTEGDDSYQRPVAAYACLL